MSLTAYVHSFRAVRNGRNAKLTVVDGQRYIETRFLIDADDKSKVLMTEGEAEDYAKELLTMIQRRRDARASPVR